MATVSVFGTWHLGSVTAAGLAELGHRVLATDLDPVVVANLKQGKPPLFEPGLDLLVKKHASAGKLTFHDPDDRALGDVDALFLCVDSEVQDDDSPSLDLVEKTTDALARVITKRSILVVTSQVPVGTTERLAKRCGPLAGVAHVPENLRLGAALEGFAKPDRLVIGADSPLTSQRVRALLPACEAVIETDLRTAEMTKHATNAYLALCVSFASELSDLCEEWEADAYVVEKALKADRRGSPKAPLRPGFGFAGGTLGRDVQALRALAREKNVPSALMDGVLAVNRARRDRFLARLKAAIGPLEGKGVALLGLTYKPGTDTLRRSSALEIASDLVKAGARVRAFDPKVAKLPEGTPAITLAKNPQGAAIAADALVIATEWPEFAELDWRKLGASMARPVVFDLKGLLDPATPGIELWRTGVARK